MVVLLLSYMVAVTKNRRIYPLHLSFSETPETVITGLKPFSTYEFRVRAHDSEKVFGQYSPPVQAMTMGSCKCVFVRGNTKFAIEQLKLGNKTSNKKFWLDMQLPY